MENPEITRIEVDFVQDGNTLGTTEECESLKLCFEFQLSEGDGQFYVIKTDGWSFDSVEELNKLINRVKPILQKNNKKR